MTDLLELDQLLAESMAASREAKVIKDSKKLLAAGNLPKQEAAKTRATIITWESKHEWETLGKTAIFTEHRCDCGSVHRTFSHWMLHQQHRGVPTRKRYTRATAEVISQTCRDNDDITLSVGLQILQADLCEDCLGNFADGTLTFSSVALKVQL